MKRTLIFTVLLLLTGCNNLSPRDNLSPQLKQQLDNQNSKLNGVEQNQAAVLTEIGKLNASNETIQKGLANISMNKENSGIQIFEGSGGILLAYTIIVTAMLLYYFYKTREVNKVATLLARHIELHNNQELNTKITEAAKITGCLKELNKLL